MFWQGFFKKASDITSKQDLEEPLMAGFHKDPSPNSGDGEVTNLKGGVDMESGNDSIDYAEGYGEARTDRGKNDYPGGI